MMENKVSEKDEISFNEFVENVKKYFLYVSSLWKIIILGGIIGGSLGLIYSISVKPVYKATLSFALEDEKNGNGGLGGALGLASSFGIDVGGSSSSVFTGSNLTELFKSRVMVEKTLLSPVTFNKKKMSLAEMYMEIKGWRSQWEKNPILSKIVFLPHSKRENFTRVQDSVLARIYTDLSTSSLFVGQKDKKISIINIDVTFTHELFAKFFCEALAKEVSDFYIETKSKRAKQNMIILIKQTDSIRRELNNAITGVAVANDNTFNLNPALNVQRAPSARRQVDVQANTAILTELVKQTELAKVTLRKETPLIQIIDKPILPLEYDQLGKIKAMVFGFFLGMLIMIIYVTVKRLFSSLIVSK